MHLIRLIFVMLFLLSTQNGHTAITQIPSSSISQSHTRLSLKSSTETIQPNSEFWLLLDWSLDHDWYIYAQNPGDGGLPPTLEFDLPTGITVEEIVWPKEQNLSKEGLIIYGYTNKCKTFIRLKAAPHYKASDLDTITISLKWGICYDQCVVDHVTMGLKFPTKNTFDKNLINKTGDIQKTSTNTSLNKDTNIELLLIFALIGGMLLNLMPCVLPVLSLKLLDFTKLRDKTPRGLQGIRTHALLYTAGVLTTFQCLNISLTLLRFFGHHVGWGFQLQSPPFLVFLACLFLTLTLNLFGIFEIGLRAIHLEQGIASNIKNTRVQSFLKGVLACIVATPCSAPFMGTAIAASLVQPFWINTLIFISLGIGLSLPFLGLIIFPNIINYLPKPGAWMKSLRQFMGFLMLGSVGWMLWILSARFSDNLCWILIGFWFLSLGLWFYGTFCPPIYSTFRRSIGLGLLLFCSLGTILSFYYGLDEVQSPKNQTIFQPYTQAAVDAALADDRPVLINFTARWCITCQTNKKLVLESKAIVDYLKENDVCVFEADWTHHDAAITQKLESFGYNSIPLIVYYPKKKNKNASEPIFLSAVLTKEKLLEILSK